jgi:hypothetical protein
LKASIYRFAAGRDFETPAPARESGVDRHWKLDCEAWTIGPTARR